MTCRDASVHVALRASPLDAASITEIVRRADCGAIVTFEGTVRTPDRGRDVEALDYEAYEERALAQLQAHAESVIAEHGVHAVAVEHRTGRVAPTEPAIVLGVAGSHRTETFAAAADLMERIKADVAIWKQEVSAAGSEWIEP